MRACALTRAHTYHTSTERESRGGGGGGAQRVGQREIEEEERVRQTDRQRGKQKSVVRKMHRQREGGRERKRGEGGAETYSGGKNPVE